MRSILITGSSSGFGRATAVELARAGWRVFASMRNTAKAGDLVEQAKDGTGQLIPLALDVTDPASVEAAIAAVLEQTGGTLDALLCNAGYSILGSFEDYGDELCRKQMETNFFGTLAVTRAVLPAMRTAQCGRIVIVSSNAVNSPHPMLSLYAASKWALEGWAEGLAMEVAPFGIEVCVLQPGAHRTEFAGNVQFVQPEGSAYGPWLEHAMPGISNLDKWGRDPGKAIDQIVSAVTDKMVPFRQQIGEDAKVFAALKATAPFETRALALRTIVGLPGPNMFVDKPRSTKTEHPVLAEVLERVLAAAQQDSDLVRAAASTFDLN